MKIGVVGAYYKPATVYGGPIRSVSALCEGLTQAGAQVTVLTTNANGAGALAVPTGQPVLVDGVLAYYYPRQGAHLVPNYYYSPGLKQACREKMRNFEVIYICGTWTYAMRAGAMAALAADVPYVVSPRGSFMTWSMSQRPIKKRVYLELIERRLMNRAAAIHCTSSLEQQQLNPWGFRPPILVIPNGLDLTPFAALPERGTLRRALGVPQDGTLSLFVGRLHKMKRLELTIQAFAKVAREAPDAHLLVVGPDGDGSGQKARKMAHDLGLSDRVHFTGLLTGMSLMQAYADADLHVLLSYRENFAMVVTEAMASGLSVMVTPDVGLAEEVEKAGAGYCVPSEGEEIAKTWLALLANPGLRRAMGQKGKSLVQEKFAFEVVSEQMLTLFKQIAGQHL
jgi:glycosyltransferase involved in cell wall biosynthesis